jgi:hypothetical protein
MRKISNILKIMAFASLLILVLGAQSYAASNRQIEYKVILGDLDGNKRVDSSDTRLLQRYFAGQEKFSLKQQVAADVDGNNKIEMADLRLITRRMVNIITAFPGEGDINQDGKVNSSDVNLVLNASVGNVKLSTDMKKCADIDGDGRITSADARLILAGREAGTRKIRYIPGDLDGDKKVDAADTRLLQRYFAGQERFNVKQLLAADVDGNMKIEMADLRLIYNRSVNWITAFPVEGDINQDGRITSADSNLALKASIGSVRLSNDMKRCADVDCDGKVTHMDSRTILRRANGLE